ncbi:RadC family protein [Pikeienuella sp. HZG-20]|uniref:RadC family protein n=1 Tax=Paludibacillus litoralis TaxID=3133267 RepID=UPI0030EC23E8
MDPLRVDSQGFGERAESDLGAKKARKPGPEADVTIRHDGREKLDGTKPHNWGHREQLRHRFAACSGVGMPECEMLELILFNAIQRIDVAPLARTLLAEFGDLNGVLVAPASRLMRVRGVTKKCVVQFRLAQAVAVGMARAKVMNRPVIASWPDLMIYCKTVMAHRETEQFRLLFLNNKYVLIADEEQAKGTIDHVPVYPREVVKRALELNAAAIILVHNHPSGDPTPSYDDIVMTRRIEAACDAVGIIVHDHIIVGKETDVSFRTLDLI